MDLALIILQRLIYHKTQTNIHLISNSYNLFFYDFVD